MLRTLIHPPSSRRSSPCRPRFDAKDEVALCGAKNWLEALLEVAQALLLAEEVFALGVRA